MGAVACRRWSKIAAGMLHSWGLTVVPEEVIPDAPQPSEDNPDATTESSETAATDSTDATGTPPKQPLLQQDQPAETDKQSKKESLIEGFKLPFKLF